MNGKRNESIRLRAARESDAAFLPPIATRDHPRVCGEKNDEKGGL